MIEILQNTLLKSLPIDSNSDNLPSDFQTISIKAGTKIDCNWVKAAENNHWILELKTPQLGRFNWYVFRDHVKVEQGEPEIASRVPINWRNPNMKISRYFSVGEVTKNDANRIPIAGSDIEANILRLARELDKIRNDWGSGIIVTSWYRPPAVNKSVGGSRNSQHLYGRAVDIKPASKDLIQFQSFLDRYWYGALGYGARKGFVHVDTRNGKGWKDEGSKGVRWNY
jgi:hypothetical protein